MDALNLSRYELFFELASRVITCLRPKRLSTLSVLQDFKDSLQLRDPQLTLKHAKRIQTSLAEEISWLKGDDQQVYITLSTEEAVSPVHEKALSSKLSQVEQRLRQRLLVMEQVQEHLTLLSKAREAPMVEAIANLNSQLKTDMAHDLLTVS